MFAVATVDLLAVAATEPSSSQDEVVGFLTLMIIGSGGALEAEIVVAVRATAGTASE